MNRKVEEMLNAFKIKTIQRPAKCVFEDISKAFPNMTDAEKTYVCTTLFNY